MMFVKMCVVWQESQQCLPCRVDKTGFNQNGEARCRVRSSQTQRPLLPSGVRLAKHRRDISAPAHESHQAAAHPPHLVTSTSDSLPLVASSVCSHAKQARGRSAATCTFQLCKRIKQKSRTLDKSACTVLIQKGSVLHRHPSKTQSTEYQHL